MDERGKLIQNLNPQPEVRRNAENAVDWEYKEEAAFLYRLAVVFRDRLVDPILRVDRSQVPDPVISFDNMRNNNVLAAYTLARNPQGLLHEITLNTENYIDQEGKKVWRYGRWAQAESLLHEMLHLKQQKYGKDPYKRGKSTHNKEFCDMAKQLGLNVTPNVGSHFTPADVGSPFDILMKEMGIERPVDVPTVEDKRGRRLSWFEIGKREKGRSSLTKWTCPECGLNARIGIKGDPYIIHAPCTEKTGKLVFFVRVDLDQIAPQVKDIPIDLDDEIDRRQTEEYNPWNDPEDLTTYLEPYQND